MFNSVGAIIIDADTVIDVPNIMYSLFLSFHKVAQICKLMKFQGFSEVILKNEIFVFCTPIFFIFGLF